MVLSPLITLSLDRHILAGSPAKFIATDWLAQFQVKLENDCPKELLIVTAVDV